MAGDGVYSFYIKRRKNEGIIGNNRDRHLLLPGGFNDEKQCKQFRNELSELQNILRIYSKMLADMAGVEGLTELEE